MLMSSSTVVHIASRVGGFTRGRSDHHQLNYGESGLPAGGKKTYQHIISRQNCSSEVENMIIIYLVVPDLQSKHYIFYRPNKTIYSQVNRQTILSGPNPVKAV